MKFLAQFSAERGWGVLGPMESALLSALWEQPATLLELHRRCFRSASYTALTGACGRLHKKGLVRRDGEPSAACGGDCGQHHDAAIEAVYLGCAIAA